MATECVQGATMGRRQEEPSSKGVLHTEVFDWKDLIGRCFGHLSVTKDDKAVSVPPHVRGRAR